MAAKKLNKCESKHYKSILDFTVDRTDWLQGDTILSSTWAIPAPLTDNGNIFTPEGVATVWIGGGVVESKYVIENTIITTNGKKDVQCINIIITDC